MVRLSKAYAPKSRWNNINVALSNSAVNTIEPRKSNAFALKMYQ